MKVFTTNKHWCRMKIKHGNVRHIDGNNKTQSGLSRFVLWNFSPGTVSNGYISSHSSQLYLIPTYVNCIYYILAIISQGTPAGIFTSFTNQASLTASPASCKVGFTSADFAERVEDWLNTKDDSTWKPATHTQSFTCFTVIPGFHF